MCCRKRDLPLYQNRNSASLLHGMGATYVESLRLAGCVMSRKM